MSSGFNHQEAACDLTDRVLLGAFQKIYELAKAWGTPTLQAARFGPSSQKPIKNADANAYFHNDPTGGELRTFYLVSLSVADNSNNTVTISFSRTPKTLTISVSCPNEAASAIKTVPAAVAAIHEQGLVAPRTQESASNPDNAILRALAEQVAAMRDLINKQMLHNEEQRAMLLEEHTERANGLEREFQERLQRIKSDHETFESETKRRFAEREQLLDERAKTLDERETKLDLQSERDARRKLREKIQAAATKMFEKPDLSEDAKRSFERVANACRWTIGGSAIVLLLAFFGPVVLELRLERELSSELVWLAWSIRGLSGVTFVAALIYYVSSLSAWSRQVAAIEMRSKQFALDIDRASWLVEMALEYEKEGKALPTAMVESFTRGLFDGGAQGAQHEPPSASLLHLIQNAESLKVGAAGAELTLTGKQIRKADAQAGKGG